MDTIIKNPFCYSLLDSLPIGIFCTDAQGHSVFFNKYLQELLGIMINDTANSWMDVIHPNDKQFVTVNWYAAARLCLPFKMEFRYLLNNNEIIWSYCQATPLFGETGKLSGYIGAITDISDQKTLKISTRDSKSTKEYLELGLESANTGVWSWNIANDTLIWDKRVYELFDIPYTKTFPCYDDFLSCIHPEDLDFVKNDVRSVLINNSSPTNDYCTEYRIILRNKKIRHIRSFGRAYFNENGNPIFLTGICREITEQKENEYRLRRQQVASKHIAQQHAISETASSLAHELNQPLTAIATYAQLCIKQIQTEKFITDELKNALQHIAKQSERAGDIIHRIKNIARQQNLYYEKVNIYQLINESIELLGYENVGKLPELLVEIAAELPAINLDRIQIQQVIINLIKNSIEALQEKICTALKNNDKIAITITDNAIVIPASLKTRIFEPYFTTKKTGLGIGLAICRSIIETHRGQLVLCYSNKHKGTCFKFTLPLH